MLGLPLFVIVDAVLIVLIGVAAILAARRWPGDPEARLPSGNGYLPADHDFTHEHNAPRAADTAGALTPNRR